MEQLNDEHFKNVWSELYYGIYSTIIKDNNFQKCAEIGIGYGLHAKEILENTNITNLYLIDPMIYYPNDQFACDVITKFGEFDNLVTAIKNNLRPYENRYTWFRQPSLTISNEQIPDGSLDSVFIDGDHSYEAVKNDLIFWWKKIRKGGWMLGDDFYGFADVRNAVNEFANENNLNYELLLKNNTLTGLYPIYKFVKN